MNETPDTLLAPEDLPAVTVEGAGGASPFIFIADHAGQRMPRRLGTLGLAVGELDRHIAWDIGAGAVASLLGKALDALVIRQTYSRLVIDCNRTPGSATSIVELSELTRVPGNIGICDADRRARLAEIFNPYHDRIARELDRRREERRAAVLVSMHSFTPIFKAVPRSWHVGVLHNRDPRFAHAVLEGLNRESGLVVGDNEPYRLSDESDYTIPIHGEKRGLLHVELEIRQDLITEEAGQRRWAALLARLLERAAARLKEAGDLED